MKISKLLLIFSLSGFISLSAQQINPITQAMLDGYEQLLKENPNDYLTLYDRAQQYYRLSRYDLALTDIKRAIENTPVKDKALLASEYSLIADIYTQTRDYNLALDAVNNALVYSPADYRLLYMKGNICLYLKDAELAKNTFMAMTRVQSRSQEAMIGLAKVAVMQNNYPLAEEYISQAEKLNPSSYLTYCRIGDLRCDMGNNPQAAADYISAYSLNTSSERPLSSMMRLAAQDYNAAISAIDYALTHTSNEVPLNFLKGNIALSTGHYADAYESYRHLIEGNPQSKSTLAQSMSRICLALGKLQEANEYANLALANADNEQNNLLKAMIEEANGNYASAIIYASNVLRLNPNSDDALLLAASLRSKADEQQDALNLLNTALLYNPENARVLLMRGIINKSMNADGQIDFLRASSIDGDGEADKTYRAIAQFMSGMSLDSSATIQPILDAATNNADAAFLAAIYYANIGEKSLSRTFADKASALGFEDAYRLKYCTNPLIGLGLNE